MQAKSKIVLALTAGVASGAAVVQGLHAQAKAKAYLITETEVLDPAALSKRHQVANLIAACRAEFVMTPASAISAAS